MKSIRPRWGRGIRAGATALPAVLAFTAAAAAGPDAGAPAAAPLTILAVDPAGAVRVRIDAGAGAADPAYFNLVLLRVLPGTEGAAETTKPVGIEMVAASSGSSEFDLFREVPPEAGATGPCRIELRRFRDGAAEENACAAADVWRGSLAPDGEAAVLTSLQAD